jgi:hypothetical protein
MEAKEFFNLGMSGDASSEVASMGLSILFKKTNMVAKTLENDAVHQSTEGTTDLIHRLKTLLSVLKIDSTHDDDLHSWIGCGSRKKLEAPQPGSISDK